MSYLVLLLYILYYPTLHIRVVIISILLNDRPTHNWKNPTAKKGSCTSQYTKLHDTTISVINRVFAVRQTKMIGQMVLFCTCLSTSNMGFPCIQCYKQGFYGGAMHFLIQANKYFLIIYIQRERVGKVLYGGFPRFFPRSLESARMTDRSK